MTDANHDGRLRTRVEAQAGRIRKAEREKRTLLASTIYLGTLGVMFILPVIVGAYAGNWLDNRLRGYSFSWTITLIILGVFIGATNVYLFIRGK